LLEAYSVDKKTVTIIILSIIILGLLVYIFGISGPNSSELKRRIDSAIERSAIIEKSAGRLQTANTELVNQLEEERNISTGLQTAKQESDRIITALESQNREQGEIIDSIKRGDSDIDDTIERIDDRLERCQEYGRQLTEGIE